MKTLPLNLGSLAQSAGEMFIDPATGYQLISDEQAYRDASTALVEANRALADMANLLNWYDGLIAQMNASAYPVPSTVITDRADLLGNQQTAQQHQATLQDFVNRYRIQVYGSGVSGLGALGLLPVLVVAIAVGATAVAAALGYFLYRSYNLADKRAALVSETLKYKQWVADQVASGAIDSDTASTLLANVDAAAASDSGGGILGLLQSGTGFIVVAVAGFLVVQAARK